MKLGKMPRLIGRLETCFAPHPHLLTCAAALCGLLSLPPAALADNTAAEAAKFHMNVLPGYLPRAQLPNSFALLPPPPAAGTVAFAQDKEASVLNLHLRGTPRWDMAIEDANLSFPAAAGAFSCALQAPVTEAGTPILYRTLRRTLTDAGLATYTAKNHYNRTRPFVANGAPICTPNLQEPLRKDGSYPSGHTAVGWAWALVLTEIAPDRADAILARGRAFGENRVVCNVHWLSDVEEGRFVGAATVAELHSSPEFEADLAAAKKELAAIRARHLPPSRDCAAETAAMAVPFDK